MTQVRRTAVAWDPTLIRVEYLDHEGNPYYCCFEPHDLACPPNRVQPPARPVEDSGDTTERLPQCVNF